MRRRIQRNLQISEAVAFLRALTNPGKYFIHTFQDIKSTFTFNLGISVGEAAPVYGGSVGAELALLAPEPLEQIPVRVGDGLGGAALVHDHGVHGQAVQGGKPGGVRGEIVILILLWATVTPLHVSVTRSVT